MFILDVAIVSLGLHTRPSGCAFSLILTPVPSQNDLLRTNRLEDIMEINAMAMRYSLYPALDAPFYNTRHPAPHRTVISQRPYPLYNGHGVLSFPLVSSLSLLRLNTHRHSLLLANKLHKQRPNNLPQECNGRRAHVIPYLNADGTQWRAGERQYPLHVVREPASRQGENGGLGVPELQEDFESVCAEPSGAFDAPVERGFLGGDGFVCRTGGVLVSTLIIVGYSLSV